MTPPVQDDPKKLLFTLMTAKNSPWYEENHEGDIKALLNASPNMTIKDISTPSSDGSVEDRMINLIKQQVRAHGTLKEVMIFGHGFSGQQVTGATIASEAKYLYLKAKENFTGKREDEAISVHMDSFLTKLMYLQKELGVKTTDRIVFMGCNVLTNLSADQVKFYRDSAKNLGAEIAGATQTIVITGNEQANKLLQIEAKVTAPFEKFTPQGEVKPDVLSATPRSYDEKIAAIFSGGSSLVFGANSDWVKCHENKTQAEGAACQQEQQSAFFPWNSAKSDPILSNPILNSSKAATKSVKTAPSK